MESVLKLLSLMLALPMVMSDFTPHFRKFLSKSYGQEVEKSMMRSDMGGGMIGSFGGMEEGDVLRNQPVIFVHGVTLRAGVFVPHRAHFMKKGYNSYELFATTYGDGGQTPMFSKDMRCEDVVHIRDFIRAVSQYTNSTVDIIAYSMGVAITRKALLGGNCVDTREYIGEPLTKLVDTFVAVAGVAYGLEKCPEYLHACNRVNGMACNSKYLRNVNAQPKRYEAKYTFELRSTGDNVVGQDCCDHQCSELKYATGVSKFSILDHGPILTLTKDIQLEMIRNHNVCDDCPLDGGIDRKYF
uniref:Lipase domain-containing protein n=1 Tax=Panagrellus redivivus TaxID=6233 RepID=A0A7E4ZR93_PANRE